MIRRPAWAASILVFIIWIVHGAKAAIGLGGGSVLDTAKLVASCAVCGKPVEAYQLCETPLPADHLPIIAVPTTAGTGAEVTPTLAAARTLATEGVAVRVVAMPCMELFEAQEERYRAEVLPPGTGARRTCGSA